MKLLKGTDSQCFLLYFANGPNKLAFLYGRLLTLPENTKLGWQGLLGTKLVAYFTHSKVLEKKNMFVNSVQVTNSFKIWIKLIDSFLKLDRF